MDISPAANAKSGPKSPLKVLAELESNLDLVRDAMERVAAADPTRLAPLSKRHSELVAEIAALSDSDAREDPFDAFLDPQSNVIGISTAQARKSS